MKTIRLREAELSDYAEVKVLYEDVDFKYHWIYFSNHTSTEEQENARRFFGDDFLDELENEWKNYTVERFTEELSQWYTHIFMVEDCTSNEVIGYLKIYYCQSGVYKIAEWAMIDPSDDDAKVQVIQELLGVKLPRVREFVITTMNYEAQAFLTANGFVPSGAAAFYHRNVKKTG